MTIDTLKVARRLREAGFSEPQAEAVVVAVQEGAESGDLATKRDIADLRGDTQRDIADLRSDTKRDIADLRSEMHEMEQRLVARIEAMKAEIMSRMMTMILSAVLVNVVTVLGAKFAAVRLFAR